MKNLHLTSPSNIKQVYLDKLKTFCLSAPEKDIMRFFERCHLGNLHIEHHFHPEKYHHTLSCGQGSETSNVLTSCHLCRTFMRVVIEAVPERPELKQFFKRTPDSCPTCAERKSDSLSRVHRLVECVRGVHDSNGSENEKRDIAFFTRNALYRELVTLMTTRDNTFEHIKVRVMRLEQRSLHHYYVEWIEEQSLPNDLLHNVAFSATIKSSTGYRSKEATKHNPHGFIIDTFDVTQLEED
ncbi:hypothetical protein KB976_004391 [Vibrio parahaemolyticus]|nr:hypothetical protein [Vibrio parahaemolyticus]